MKTLYTAHAVATGRDGNAKTDDGLLSVHLARPGSGKTGTNPEQLFAAGYGACFASAVQYLAGQQKLTLSGVSVQADVNLNQDEKTGFSLGVTLNVLLPGLDKKTAEQLVQKAHQDVCPYSKATRGNIEVTLKVNDQPLSKAA
jgi:lipoyl-dependent peroxiredoxin